MALGTAIILIIVAVIAGYVFGLVDSRFTSSLRKKNQNTPPVAQQPANQTNRPGEHTVLLVSVDKELKWHIELDGTRLEKPDEISPEQRQRAVNVVMQMRPWLDGKPVPAAATTLVTPAPRPTPQPLNPPSPAQTTTVNQDALKISGLRGFSSMITKDVKTAVEKKPASMVTMIDEVLQSKLPGTPFGGKDIRLEDGPMGEVMVHVGARVYAGIDAVPEPEIRNIIRSAIADWEKR